MTQDSVSIKYGLTQNHNETVIRPEVPLRPEALNGNHNETVLDGRSLTSNHNETVLAG